MTQKIISCVFAVCLLIGSIHKSDADIALQISAGYDTNASRNSESDPSALAQYRISFDHSFFPNNPLLQISGYLNGTYQDYFQVDDNYRLKAGGSVVIPLRDGTIQPGFNVEAAAYRDKFVSEDERDEWMVGGELLWLASGRLSLNLCQIWAFLDYRQPYIISNENIPQPLGRKPFVYLPVMAVGGVQEIEQKDQLTSESIEMSFYLTPDLSSQVSVGYGKLKSSVKIESYTQKSFGLSANWTPDNRWSIECGLTGYLTTYEQSIGMILREDVILSFWSGVTRKFSGFDGFIRVDWFHNDSSIDKETYHRFSTQCGVEYSF